MHVLLILTITTQGHLNRCLCALSPAKREISDGLQKTIWMHWCVNDIPVISHISPYQVYGLFGSTIQKTLHSKAHCEDVLHLDLSI